MKKTELKVFALSLTSSLAVLLTERSIGIGWDYHPDSVYYVTNSAAMVEALSLGGIGRFFNNGYYVLCWLLGESVVVITTLNAVLFAVTNALLYRAHVAHADASTRIRASAIWLLLLNPYRLHLSTTVLKDTSLIFLAVLCTPSVLRFLKVVVFMAFFRIAAVLYGAQHLRGRYLVAGVAVLAGAIVLFPQAMVELILKSSELEMVFRDFDAVPTFQAFGLTGSLLRALVWPLFAISGVFVVLSPSLMYVPVALGSLFTLLYCGLVVKSVRIPLGIFGALFAFGLLVTGFTSYIRYVYPLLTIWPLALLYQRTRAISAAQVPTGKRRFELATRMVRVLQRAPATERG